MDKFFKYLLSILGVVLVGFIIFVIVMFATGKWGIGNVLDRLVGYKEYEKVVKTDSVYCDDKVGNILKENKNIKISNLNDFTIIDLKNVTNGTPFLNYDKPSLTMYFDDFYTMYRFTYLSDDNFIKGSNELTNLYMLCYRNFNNEDRTSYKTIHNEIIAFGVGFQSIGVNNFESGAFEINLNKNINVNDKQFYYNNFNVFDIVKSFANATNNQANFENDKMTLNQGFCQLQIPFIFGNSTCLYQVNASVITNSKGALLDHFITYNRTGVLMNGVQPLIRNDLAELVYKNIYINGQNATNLILTDSQVDLINNANCSYL